MSWKALKLERVIEVKKGKYITKKNSKEGPYPVILGGKEPAYYIDKFNHEGKAIVVSRSGASAGYVSFWDEPIFVTDGFLIEPKEGVSIEFLYYLMKMHEKQLQGLQGGSAIPHVTPRTIGAVNVLDIGARPREDRRTWQETQMEARRESVPVLDGLLFSWGLVLVAVEVMRMAVKAG